MIDIIGWMGSFLLLFGAFLIARKTIWGWPLCLVGEFLWVVKSYYMNLWDLFTLCAVFCLVYAQGWWKWRKDTPITKIINEVDAITNLRLDTSYRNSRPKFRKY